MYEQIEADWAGGRTAAAGAQGRGKAPGKTAEAPCAVRGCGREARQCVNGRGACSIECLELLLRAAAEEEERRDAAAALGVRPQALLGRILLEQGSITEAQLTAALTRQRATGAGKLGRWLKQAGVVSDHDLTAALAAQWRCPVIDGSAGAAAAASLPRPLMERFQVVPVLVEGRLFLGFEDRLPAGLCRAMERIHGQGVAAGVLSALEFWQATRAALGRRGPRVEEVEADSPGSAARAMAWLLTEARSPEAKLSVVDGCCWLRFCTADGLLRDLVCTVETFGSFEREIDQQATRQLTKRMARVLA